MKTGRCMIKPSPGVMKWVVDTSGLEVSAIAKRLRVPESAVRGWMQESHEISAAKLQNLSEYVKRPFAVFFLKNPPEEPELPDYRRPSSDARITQYTALAIRIARYLQESAGEMMGMLGEDPSPNMRVNVTVRQSPEKAALEERRRLNIDGRQRDAKSGNRAYRLYNVLRDAVEEMNIPVFQQSAKLEEIRGLSLSDKHPCVILINSKDAVEARRFTLMHEYAHILLRKGGLCVPDVRGKGITSGDQAVESWCNRFAAFMLMPRAEFQDEYQKLAEVGVDGIEMIESLSRKFATSRTATAIHARDLGLGAHDVPDGTRNSILKRGGGRVNPPSKCINERGKKFVALVLAAKHAQLISSRDAYDYLDTDLKYIAAIEEILS